MSGSNPMQLDFVAMATHELRMPLTAARGYLELLRQEEITLSDDQEIFLERAYITIVQLSGLVENLYSVSRIELGTLTLNQKPLNWMNMVHTITQEHESLARTKGLKIEVKQPATEIPEVTADGLHMAEVLKNLLTNAITYTDAPGIVTISVEYNKDEVTTHIADTGVGIPEDMQQHLFSKFFKLSAELGQGVKGTGLGLYISKAIVEMHNGKIWAESTEGVGSKFSFSIPIFGTIVASAPVAQ